MVSSTFPVLGIVLSEDKQYSGVHVEVHSLNKWVEEKARGIINSPPQPEINTPLEVTFHNHKEQILTIALFET